MRLFASTTPRGLGGRERCTSARSSRAVDANPPSPLAQPLTKRKVASASTKKSSRRSKNAVHPIDLRDLASELDLLRDPNQNAEILEKPQETYLPRESPRGYTVTISVLHALDLLNPCQIRSCSHTFSPFVELIVDDAPPIRFDAARHARNHSSWSKQSRLSHSLTSESIPRLHLLRVGVAALCSRHPSESTLVTVGRSDDIPLSLDPVGVNVSQFYPVFRYQTVQRQMVKYFAGKVKLAISITPDSQPIRVPDPPQQPNTIDLAEALSPDANVNEPVAPIESARAELAPVARPSFLPANFGDALQLKRKQLKATVAPTVENHALCKAHNDPLETQGLLERLHVRASHHLVRICDVHVLEAIGEGIHANVFRAQIDGIAHDVAMKEFRYEAAATGALPPLAVLRAFEQEYEMLSQLSASGSDSSCHGKRTVSLLGAMLTPRLAIFTDYCSDGSLARCLAQQQLWIQVSLHTKLILGHQIASGIADLHRCNVVHRDIKPHNIMIHGLRSTNPVSMIGDLGSAVIKLPSDEMLHEETGSTGYTAPEVFQAEGYDHRADIWSLGIVLWELVFNDPTDSLGARPRNPFIGACGDELVRKVERGERPDIPRNVLPSWLESLLRSCWERNPSLRPTASDIAVEFASHLVDSS